MNFYTFCVDIKKHNQKKLTNILTTLIWSLDKYVAEYHLIIYTNFDLKINHENIEIRKYYNNNKAWFSNNWLNLSFNKLSIYNDLKKELNKDYIWIDIDVVVCAKINYINDYSNFFCTINNGSNNPNILMNNNSKITVPRKNYIQGCFFKHDENSYRHTIKTIENIKKRNLIPRYDLQDIYNYGFYIDNKDLSINVNINGYNCLNNIEYGVGWGRSSSSFHNLYVNKQKELINKKTQRKIHMLGFVMDYYTNNCIKNIKEMLSDNG